MPDQIDIDEADEAALDRVWRRLGPKMLRAGRKKRKPLAESTTTDKLGRKMCYDDTSGKHVPCGGEASPAPGNAPSPDDSSPGGEKIAAMSSAHRSNATLHGIDNVIADLSEKATSLRAVVDAARKDHRVNHTAYAALAEQRDKAVLAHRQAKEKKSSASREAFLSHFAIPEGERVKPKAILGMNPASVVAKQWTAASSFLESVVRGDTPAVRIEKAPTGRANYKGGAIRAGESDDAGVMCHEFGHHLESTSPAVKAKVQAFRAKRFKEEDAKPMAEVTPGAGYGPQEIGNPDDMLKTFGNANEAYYSGVVYEGGETEIVSLGLELLYRDPVGFAEKDGEYFHLMLEVLHGERGGQEKNAGKDTGRIPGDVADTAGSGGEVRGDSSGDGIGDARLAAALRGGEEYPDSSGGVEGQPTAKDIQRKTHKLADVIAGRLPVGVEGRGGKDTQEARSVGLYTAVVGGAPIYARTENDAKPLEDYLRGGGRYGTPEFSRLLGYSPDEIEEYKRFLVGSGQGDIITHDERRGYRQTDGGISR